MTKNLSLNPTTLDPKTLNPLALNLKPETTPPHPSFHKKSQKPHFSQCFVWYLARLRPEIARFVEFGSLEFASPCFAFVVLARVPMRIPGLRVLDSSMIVGFGMVLV